MPAVTIDRQPLNRIQQKTATTAEVFIYDQIGQDWWTGEGITAQSFAQALADLGPVQQIDVRINSPGGLVFDGHAIYNALKNHPATVCVYIDGLAASIASIIAMAGDSITMAENAALMIHEPSTVIAGTAADLAKEAQLLQTLSEISVQVYAARSGMDPQAVRQAMAAETWYTAADAKAAGLIDSISPNKQLTASVNPDSARFQRVPAWVREQFFARHDQRIKHSGPESTVDPLADSPAPASLPKGEPMPQAVTPAPEAAPAADSAPTPPAPAGETTPAPSAPAPAVVEVTPLPYVQINTATLKQWSDRFGPTQAIDWLAQGKSYTQALELHIDHLQQQQTQAAKAHAEALAAKDQELADLNQRLQSLRPGIDQATGASLTGGTASPKQHLSPQEQAAAVIQARMQSAASTN